MKELNAFWWILKNNTQEKDNALFSCPSHKFWWACILFSFWKLGPLFLPLFRHSSMVWEDKVIAYNAESMMAMLLVAVRDSLPPFPHNKVISKFWWSILDYGESFIKATTLPANASSPALSRLWFKIKK